MNVWRWLGLLAVISACSGSTVESTGPDSETHIPNPTGACVAPGDGSRAGYHSASGTWLLDCKNPLAREYWRVFAESPTSAYVIPRPEGDPALAAPCSDPSHPLAAIAQKYFLCETAATVEQIAVINAMAPADALAVTHYLHSQLVFYTTADAADVWRFPIASDILDACALHPAENSADFKALCDREQQRMQSGDLIGYSYAGPGAVEMTQRLNELYAITIETAPPAGCIDRAAAYDGRRVLAAMRGGGVVVLLPACVPSCPVVRSQDGFYLQSVVPAGACSPGTAPCDIGARAPCACGAGALDGYWCGCSEGTWSCIVAKAGGSVCLPCTEAGADGGASD